jgi:hypothetical protein
MEILIKFIGLWILVSLSFTAGFIVGRKFLIAAWELEELENEEVPVRG